MILMYLKDLGGPVEAFFGLGVGQSRDIFSGRANEKTSCTIPKAHFVLDVTVTRKNLKKSRAMQFLGTVLYLHHLVLVPQGVVRREAKNMNLLPTALQSHHQCWHYRGGKFKQQCCSASSFTAFNLTFLPHFVALQLFIALFNYSLQCKGCRILKLCSLNQIWKMTTA